MLYSLLNTLNVLKINGTRLGNSKGTFQAKIDLLKIPLAYYGFEKLMYKNEKLQTTRYGSRKAFLSSSLVR